jgi:hypothetical protein
VTLAHDKEIIMFKQMLRPGIIAGIIGALASIVVSVLLVLALFLPGDTGPMLYCLSTPIGILLSLGIGLLAAWLAQSRSPEKLLPGQAAVAGMIAGIASTVIGIAGTPITQQLPKWLGLQDRLVNASLYIAKMMGAPSDQLEVARVQVEQQLNQGLQSTQMAIGLACGLAISIAMGAGGAALGALIFKPTLRRKLVCSNCQAAFELGGNAFVQVAEGQPDLVDYCNWDDLARDAASQQRAVVAEVIKSKGQGRQWRCGMCKTVQAYQAPDAKSS